MASRDPLGTDDQDSEMAEARTRWIAKLDDEEAAHKQYRSLGEDAIEEYYAVSVANENSSNADVRVAYPLFWSIVQVLQGRVFSQPPTPDVRKRYVDEPAKQPIPGLPPAGGMPPGAGVAGPPAAGQSNPLGNAPGAGAGQPVPAQIPTVDDNKIAETIERALTYVIDTTGFDADGHAAVNDMLVTGGGVAKVEIDVETQEIPVMGPDGQPLPAMLEDGTPELDDAGEPKDEMQTIVTKQSVRLRHFDFVRQFKWEPQQHWTQVTWVSFQHDMTADQIEDTWGIELNNSGMAAKRGSGAGQGGAGLDSKKPQLDKYERTFPVYEIWDKTKREVLYVCPNHDEAFEIRPDPLKLDDFFPCPKPMMLNIAGDDLVPQPDFAKCESLFKTANDTYIRIASLNRQIKDCGFYDSGFPELAGLVGADDGYLLPVANLFNRLEKLNPGHGAAGFDSIVFKQDNAGLVATLQIMMQQLASLEDMIWKSYGVSDIQRGSSDPNETAAAQNIKAQWADIRVGQRIRIVALFFRDVFRIMADIIATFSPEMLYKMTGIQLNPAEFAILQNDVGRSFAIDVETDSTAAQNEYALQQNYTQFVQAITGLLKELGPPMMAGQIPADLCKQLLLITCNAFKVGRQVEDAISALPSNVDQLTKLNQQLQQQGQQMQQMGTQMQAQQKQLQGVNQQKEQRENFKTGVDAQKTAADTEHTQVETAKLAEETQGAADENARNRVLPFVAPPPRSA